MSRLTCWYHTNMQIKELARATGVDVEKRLATKANTT
jgi:hypothetical protein